MRAFLAIRNHNRQKRSADALRSLVYELFLILSAHQGCHVSLGAAVLYIVVAAATSGMLNHLSYNHYVTGVPIKGRAVSGLPSLCHCFALLTLLDSNNPATTADIAACRDIVHLDILLATQCAYYMMSVGAGALPEAWGSPRAFPALQYMGMAVNSFTGTLPETWAAPGNPLFFLLAFSLFFLYPLFGLSSK